MWKYPFKSLVMMNIHPADMSLIQTLNCAAPEVQCVFIGFIVQLTLTSDLSPLKESIMRHYEMSKGAKSCVERLWEGTARENITLDTLKYLQASVGSWASSLHQVPELCHPVWPLLFDNGLPPLLQQEDGCCVYVPEAFFKTEYRMI